MERAGRPKQLQTHLCAWLGGKADVVQLRVRTYISISLCAWWQLRPQRERKREPEGEPLLNDAETQAPPSGLISSLGEQDCLVLQPLQRVQSCWPSLLGAGQGSATNARPCRRPSWEIWVLCSLGKEEILDREYTLPADPIPTPQTCEVQSDCFGELGCDEDSRGVAN